MARDDETATLLRFLAPEVEADARIIEIDSGLACVEPVESMAV
jgi:hypothetical protein